MHNHTKSFTLGVILLFLHPILNDFFIRFLKLKHFYADLRKYQMSREGPNQGIIIAGMLLDRNGFQG